MIASVFDMRRMGVTAAKAMIQGFKEKGYGDTGEVFMIIGVPGSPAQIQREDLCGLLLDNGVAVTRRSPLSKARSTTPRSTTASM